MNFQEMDSRHILDIASAEESAPAQRLLSTAEKQREKIRKNLESNPIVSNDVKLDMKFQLGFAAGMSWLLSLPGNARKYIESIEEN